MKRKHIVILNAHNPSRLAHLRKIWSLRDRYDFTMVLKKEDDLGWQNNFVGRLIHFNPTESADGFLQLVKDIEVFGKPDGIITLSEFSLPLQAKLCEHFSLIGPDSRTVEIGRNKFSMREFAESIDIPVPKSLATTQRNLDECKNLQYPVIAKPIIGAGSTLVRKFESFEDLKKNFNEMQKLANKIYQSDLLFHDIIKKYGEFPFVVEEIVGGEVLFPTMFPYYIGEISVESICYQGKTQVLAIHDKPLPANGPYFEKFILSTPTRIPSSLVQQAESFVSKIHKGLGNGAYVLHTEFRTLSDKLILMEFGVRLGGGPIYSTLLHSTGNDFIEILIDLSLNRKPTIHTDKRCPTISHYLWALESGRIEAFKGETTLTESPYYLEHQIYDDVGKIAKRAPLSSRAHGHVIYQSWNGFNVVERSLSKALDQFEIHIPDLKITSLGGDLRKGERVIPRELFNRV